MALPTNTATAHTLIGNREDLSDEIFRIAPTETPFVSGVEKGKASAVYHEWQTQALAAPAANAVLEGDDATTDAATPTVRLGNYCQISDKVARVSGTQRAVDSAGRGDELDYQVMLKGLELKRDMEFNIVGLNQARAAGSTSVARNSASILSWIKTNNSVGTSGVAPVTIGSTTRTDGTQRAFTEAMLKTVLQACWNEGGSPETIMVGGFNKQQFSTFVGRSAAAGIKEDAKSKKIHASVDIYESDFGTLKVVPNRFSRARDALVLQMDMWKLAYLNGRKMVTHTLAKTGDSEQKQILCEWTLESCNEAASGGVFDLTTA